MSKLEYVGTPARSLPLRERGLKSSAVCFAFVAFAVAPLAGAWIEISIHGIDHAVNKVAPLAGAWIEIVSYSKSHHTPRVAPLAGAWIEIYIRYFVIKKVMSLPSRERGLK